MKSGKSTNCNKKVSKCFSGLFRTDSGAVMMEYVLVLLIMGTLLMAFSSSIYTSGSGWGALGQEIAKNYKRIMTGISLPIP